MNHHFTHLDDRAIRRSFAGLATLQMVAVVAQFFLAATDAFDTAPNDESFRTHRTLGAAGRARRVGDSRPAVKRHGTQHFS